MLPLRPFFLTLRRCMPASSCWPALFVCVLLCPAAAAQNKIGLTDVTREVKIDFQHHSPLTPERHLHLFMGSGLAWIDHDRDDWPDLYFCQGAAFSKLKDSEPLRSDQLFRNRSGVFQNITALAGLRNVDYSMGTAVGNRTC